MWRRQHGVWLLVLASRLRIRQCFHTPGGRQGRTVPSRRALVAWTRPTQPYLSGSCTSRTAIEQQLTIISTTGLCQRRKWPEPSFESYRSRYGWVCTVRVNNREYTTDTEYETDDLARNAAATRAYMICRNFSVNDGMYPKARQGNQGGVIQGLPVAIGTGRRSTYSSVPDYDSRSSSSAEAPSGGSSPRSSDSGFENHSRRSSKSSQTLCFCGRGSVRAYERCNGCLREAGWRC